jgi:N-methylhydantoinase A
MTRFGMDVGGTFTDVAGVSAGGVVTIGKVRSIPGGISQAVWTTMEALGEEPDADLAGAALIHGTTVATNALLERRGGRVVLVTTAGFEDLLWLRRQDRPDLYDLTRDHPPPVVDRADVIGARERVGSSGVLQELTAAEIARVTHEVVRRRPEAVAISLLFSFRNGEHERKLALAIREALPNVPVAASSEVLPVFREYERTSTTAVEAYLRPVASGYLARMAAEADARAIAEFRVMASNGGTLSVEHAQDRAAALALSGPAGGVEGARLIGAQLGLQDLLTLDMGGTSADASVVVGGEPLMQSTGSIGGQSLALPHILIETVGAGGGSIAWVDPGGALKVGPRSAGARPGPACYGLGGTEPTVTDAALVLGWLDPEHPLADELRLDPALAREAVARVADVAGLEVDRCAEGIVEVVTATMVRALRGVSVERGIDPRHMTLVPFGGAGPMFGCRLAESLGMSRVLVPPHAGVLSALGLASAAAKIEFASSVHGLVEDLVAEDFARVFEDLEREASNVLPASVAHRFVDCRYPGQGYELTVPSASGPEAIAEVFHRTHRERYGHADERRAVEIVNARVVASQQGTPLQLSHPAVDDIPLTGPVTVGAADFTLRIEPGWVGIRHSTGAILLERA